MSAQPRKTVAHAAALTLAAVLLLAGCASHRQAPDAPAASRPAATFPVTVTPPGGKPLTIANRPRRIVSLSAADTEILFAVGAGKQVVAVDKQSDYPPQAPHTKLDAISPSPESIAAYHPDLVIASNDMANLVSNMAKVKIPVLILASPKTIDAAYQEWSLIGRITGHKADADGVVEHAKNQISSIVAKTPKPAKPLSYYHELDPTYYTVTSKTFLGQVYSLFGLRNVADPADSAAAAGYPQLSAEQVLHANPDLIFLADTRCCSQSAKTVAARPGWNTLNAVRDGNVVSLNDDIASRWGPRIVTLVKTVAAAVTKASKHGE
ncbi:MAG: ABC transporter substrate-binding protein [Sciscionella sp.]